MTFEETAPGQAPKPPCPDASRSEAEPAPVPRSRLLSTGPVEVLEIGEGPHLLVLLHAAAQSLRAMTPLARHLARPDRRILVPRLPVDAPDVSQDANPIAIHARIAAACLAETRAGQRTLFGHSMGALAALMASTGGAACDRLVLYEPIVMAALDPRDPTDRELRLWDRTIVERMEADLRAGRAEAAVAGFVEAWNEVRWDSLPAPVRRKLAEDAPALARLVRATTDFDPGGDLAPALSVPVTLLQGAASPAVTRRMSERLTARLAGADLEILPDCGHMGPVLQAGRVAAALEKALEAR